MGKSGRQFRERDKRRVRKEKVESKRRWLLEQPQQQNQRAA